MALSAKHLCFLLFVFLVSSTLTQARESKFFSKFNHFQETDTANTTGDNNSKENGLNQEQVPSVKQEEQQTSNGYGLYGHDSNQFPSTTTESSQEYTYPNNFDKTSTEEFTGESYEDEELNTKGNNKQYGMSDTRFMDNPNVVNNNNNGYETKQYDTSDASFLENNNNGYKTQQFENNGNVNNNGYETKQYGRRVETGNRFVDNGSINNNNNNNNNNNGYKAKQYGTRFAATDNNNNKYYEDESLSKSQQQGLSDTRFMENGKYFYNVNNENSYLNNYHPVNRRYDGFNPSQVVTSRNNYNYGNDEKENVFNNFKGESQYQGEDIPDELSP